MYFCDIKSYIVFMDTVEVKIGLIYNTLVVIHCTSDTVTLIKTVSETIYVYCRQT